MARKTAEEITEGINLNGKTVLITGCNSGIGYETMRVLAAKGARIIGFARTIEKASEACKSVSKNYLPIACEMSSFKSIGNAISKITEPIDILIANAGVMAIKNKTTYHNVEAHMFINHIAHFSIVTKLKHLLTPKGRIIVVSSAAHSFAKGKGLNFDDLEWNRKYTPYSAYGHSKLANILFVKGLSTRLSNQQTVNAIHPGIVDSDLWRHVPEDRKKYNLVGVEYGAATSVFVATSSELDNVTGEYFMNCKIGKPSQFSSDLELIQKLWNVSEEILKTTANNSNRCARL